MSISTKAEIPYKTLRNLPKRRYMATGDGLVNIYEYEMDHRNIVGLKCTGVENQYEKIQMHADECKIETILAKAAVDPTILQQRKGIFTDITTMPKTITEFKNLEIKVINDWNKLDAKTKEKFDNSFDKYFAEFGSENWMKAMNINTVEELKEKVEETIEGPIDSTKPVEGGELNE